MEIIQRYAEVAGLGPRPVITAPVATPVLAVHAIAFLTPVDAQLVSPLIDSLLHATVAEERATCRTSWAPRTAACSLSTTRSETPSVTTTPAAGERSCPRPQPPRWPQPPSVPSAPSPSRARTSASASRLGCLRRPSRSRRRSSTPTSRSAVRCSSLTPRNPARTPRRSARTWLSTLSGLRRSSWPRTASSQRSAPACSPLAPRISCAAPPPRARSALRRWNRIRHGLALRRRSPAPSRGSTGAVDKLL